MREAQAIILAAGAGVRFDSRIPKQFLRLNGRMVIDYSVRKFEEFFPENPGVIVCDITWVNKIIELYPKWIVVSGGPTRHESTNIGLRALNCKHVLVHDAVRPFVSTRIIYEMLEKLQAGSKVVNTITPAVDTIVRADHEQILNIPDRDTMFLGQTPQGFDLKLLRKAYNHFDVNPTKVTDDIGVFANLNKYTTVDYVMGEPRNLKITTKEDFYLAERIAQFEDIDFDFDKLKDKRVLVLGGTGGIGQAICTHMQKYTSFVKCIGSHNLDLSSDFQIALRKEIAQRDIIIHCAGVIAEDMGSPWSSECMFNVNFWSAWEVCKYWIDNPPKTPKSIVCIGSSSHTRGRADHILYSASKAALCNMVQGAACKLCRNVTVNVVNPPRTNTKMRIGMSTDGLMSPEAVAEAVAQMAVTTKTGQIIDLRVGIDE